MRGQPARVDTPAGALRSRRERLIQTLWFEGLGLLVVGPLFAWASGASTGESFGVLAVLSAAVMAWAALYNTVFDRVEWRLAARAASQRPQRWRVVHAVGLEASAALVTWPLIVALTPLGWGAALLADLGLGLAYVVYGYVFHLGFDRLRPVRAEGSD